MHALVEAIERRAGVRWAAIAVLAILYVAAGKFGLSLAFVHASASAVWPPTGIALAAFLLFGPRIWPGIALGAFVVNLLTEGSIATCLGIAAGNTLEGLIGAMLVRRFAGGAEFHRRPAGAFGFVLAGVGATAISATLGVTSLVLGGSADAGQFVPIWLTWWLGDIGGALVVAPLLIAWSSAPAMRWTRARVAEAALAAVVLAGIGLFVFGGLHGLRRPDYPLEFLCVPVFLWIASRFGVRGTTATTFVLSGIAIVGTLGGYGPFARLPAVESLLLVQGFIAMIAVLGLVYTAGVAEHRRSESELRRAHEEAESRVRERTASLAGAVQALEAEIAERKRVEDQLLHARALEAAGRMRREFLTHVSHELRTPLNSVIGFTNILLRNRQGVLSPQDLLYLERIRDNGGHLLHLITDLLDLGRLESGRLPVDRVPVSLGALVADVLAQFDDRVRGRPVELRAEIPPDLADVAADSVRLRQILLNLVDNALKFTAAGRVVVRVVADPHTREPRALEVEDTGIGIPADRQQAIFEPFQQAESGTARTYGGTGLGLAISRSLAERMGFQLELTSTVGKGSVFRLVFAGARQETVGTVRQ